MKKYIIITITIIYITANIFSQSIFTELYIGTNQIIDIQFQNEYNNITTNYEWQQLVLKYSEIWKNQLQLEYNRLYNYLENDEKMEFQQLHIDWKNYIEQYTYFIENNINLTIIGKENYLKYAYSVMMKYRDKAIEYLQIYYSMQLKDGYELDYVEIKLAE